ncbi:hypothetical protein SAMN05421770_105218 [Granulicella rosea]|uniref:OmpA family protein n=1 Tax=Granulicella rosea TaxID=474952 RepID=A0A239KUK6_9BACT|nr:hypothetical protein [Granulicella rosea]SNT21745.1 hypothetical protein SAMN05421770_105218 [Granulicella rosea]
MNFRLSHPIRATLCAATLALSALTALAQDAAPAGPPAPPSKPRKVVFYDGPRISRVDIYGGYGYVHPVNSDINNVQYQPINPGAVVSVAGYYNKYIGLQAEGNFFPHGPDDCIFGAQGGPIVRFQKGRFVPFAHALVGGAKVGGPVFQPCTWGLGITGGIGFDYIVPGLGDHLAIRPIQSDFIFSQVNYGPLVTPADVSGGFGQIQGYRLSAGAVLRFGDVMPATPITMSCAVQPQNVYPGDPLVVTATPMYLNPKKPATYRWTSTGGTIAGSAETAQVMTKGVQPGTYTVTGHVSQGPKPTQMADCTSTFTVKPFEPPTLSCAANPSVVTSGDTSVITAVGVSPQNRTLTYSFMESAGQISGANTTATLATAGLPATTVTVTCNTVDDLGQTATATAMVTVNAPAAPAAPAPQNLCSVAFDRDKKRPVRVDNEAKACLDDIALTMQRQADAKLVIVGNFADGEKPTAAEERALNVQQYLTAEKGIDASRIELRTGASGTRSVDDTLLPAGATFPAGSTTTFDGSTVKRHGQAYGVPHTAAKKR